MDMVLVSHEGITSKCIFLSLLHVILQKLRILWAGCLAIICKNETYTISTSCAINTNFTVFPLNLQTSYSGDESIDVIFLH